MKPNFLIGQANLPFLRTVTSLPHSPHPNPPLRKGRERIGSPSYEEGRTKCSPSLRRRGLGGGLTALLWAILLVFAGGVGAQNFPQKRPIPPLPKRTRAEKSRRPYRLPLNSVKGLERYLAQRKAQKKATRAEAAEPDRDRDAMPADPDAKGRDADADREVSRASDRDERKTAHAKPETEKDKDEDETLDALGARLHFLRQRAYPNDHIDWNAYRRAILHRDQMRPGLSAGGRSAGGFQAEAALNNRWQFVGPQNMTTPYSYYNGPGLVSGRVNALAFDPAAPGTYYLGGPVGGVWKTVDSGQTWTPLSDSWPLIGVSSLALDPTNHLNLYVGTGDFDGGDDLIYGVGMMKSTDGGQTWTNTGKAQFGNVAVSKVVVDPETPSIVTVATGGGEYGYALGYGYIWRSTDSGTTWKQAFSTQTMWSGLSYGIKDATGKRYLYAAGDGGQFWSSQDRGVTWKSQTLPAANMYYLRIAASLTSPTTVYLIDGNNDKIYKSVSAGATGSWMDITNNFPTGSEAGPPDYNWSQSFYDIYIACSTRTVNNVPQDILYVGLLDVDQSLSGGASWRSIGGPVYSDAALLHTDQHAFAVNPSNPNDMLVGNDGGVYHFTYDPNADTWSFNSLNATLGITEFYAAAFHPTDPTQILTGAQDNGSPASLGDLGNWSSVTGGDGGGAAINPANPVIQYSTAEYSTILRTADGWRHPNDSNYPEDIVDISPNTGNDTSPFITPITLDPTNPDILYTGTNYLWQWNDAQSGWTPRLGNKALAGTNYVILTIAVDPRNGNHIFTGSEDGQLWMTTNGGTSWSNLSNGLPARSITSIAVNPTNSNSLLVTVSGTGTSHVWRGTTNGFTASWTNISGSGANTLPDVPTNGIALDLDDPQHTYYVATDVGVFMSTDSGANWSNITAPLGLPNVEVTQVTTIPGTRSLYATTYGRGMWRLNLNQTSAQITNLGLNPSSVVAGWPSMATITFAAGVPSGTTVTLTSSNTAVATVPASIPVTTGATSAMFTVTTLIGGPTTTSDITASVNGTSAKQTLTITAPTTVTVPNQSGALGYAVTLTGTLQNGTTAVSGKTLAFTVDGTSAGSGTTDTNGTASVTYTLPISLGGGTHTINAAFVGDADYNASNGSGTLTTHFNTLTTVATATATVGQKIALRGLLRRYPDGVRISGETLAFTVDGTSVGTATTGSDGLAALNYTVSTSLSPGSHVLGVSFAGDSTYATSQTTGTLTVHYNTLITVANATGLVGQKIALRGLLRRYPDGVRISGETLAFTVDGTTVGTATTDSTGLASLSYTVPASVGPGSHVLGVSFAGDSKFNAASGTGTFTAGYNTLITVANTSGKAGQTVLLRGLLRRYPDGVRINGETLSFQIDGTNVGTATTDSTGLASLSYAIPAGTAAGSHTLTVTFTGGGGYLASTGNGTLTVNP